MSEQQILETAIRKAIDGGWKFAGSNNDATIVCKYRDDYFAHDPYFEIDWHMPTAPSELSVFDIIFNHDFAKALWGEGEKFAWGNGPKEEEAWYTDGWRGHLQQMVIADDPIKYLGDNLPA